MTEQITLTIDDREVTVPKGTNLIEAAAKINSEIPYYCYHKDLSVVGNCRMCQVEVEGMPKLMIGCHMQVQPNMKVRTQKTSEKVKKAQGDNLELILINHPLDCTVCDQAGHCKLQDYHFEYNAEESRFIEKKEHKPKAVPLGPTVMLDAERCIMCTRCIRFCDEITGTSELGMINRGDRSQITVNPGKELDNPFSGTVVDLCPVGALTHKNWRFNTRIWYTKQADTICPGCSTGCNVKVAVRDNQVVHVKARYNEGVNKEWLCDEGRYGFERFIPKEAIQSAYQNGEVTDLQKVLQAGNILKSKKALFLLAPDLFQEDFCSIKEFVEKFSPESEVVVAYRERSLNELEKILISPDYAANIYGARSLGFTGNQETYLNALEKIKHGAVEDLVLVGDRAIFNEDLSSDLLKAILETEFSLGLLSEKQSTLFRVIKNILPARSLFQQSGTIINSKGMLQKFTRLLEYNFDTYPKSELMSMIAKGS